MSRSAGSAERPPTDRGPAVLIVGGLLTSPWMYLPMRRNLLASGASRVWIAPVFGMHWLVTAFVGLGSAAAVVAATADHLARVDGRPIILVAHSGGGVLARLATATAPFEGSRRASPGTVGALVTLGTPHGATRVDGTLGHHGRRALRFLARHGSPPDAPPALTAGSELDLSIAAPAAPFVQRMRAGLASVCYAALRGPAARRGPGDGMVPFESAFLPGSVELRLHGLAHAQVLWGAPWYGSPEGIAQWWGDGVRLWREAVGSTEEAVVRSRT